jgi:hypothetical protein
LRYRPLPPRGALLDPPLDPPRYMPLPRLDDDGVLREPPDFICGDDVRPVGAGRDDPPGDIALLFERPLLPPPRWMTDRPPDVDEGFDFEP